MKSYDGLNGIGESLKDSSPSPEQTFAPPRENISAKADLKNQPEADAAALERTYQRIARINVDKPLSTTVIIPPEELKDFINQAVQDLTTQTRLQLPAIAHGFPVATTYDSQICNFSAQTRIIKLPSGERLFALHKFPSSWVTRSIIDRAHKWLVGCRIKKVDSQHWKSLFEAKTQIPTIECSDPNTILMPFIPSINLQDLFTRQDKMKDFGECGFAKEYTTEDLMKILEKVAKKLRVDIHGIGLIWGEIILPNLIIDSEQNVHICDPESQYRPDLSLSEQQARDLFLLIISSASAINKSSQVDYTATVKRILDAYGDSPDTMKKLQKVAEEKTRFIQKIFFGAMQSFLGVKNREEYENIKKAIVEYVKLQEK